MGGIGIGNRKRLWGDGRGVWARATQTGQASGAGQSSFGHVFTSEGRTYYYDTHRNEIIEVEPELGALLAWQGPDSGVVGVAAAPARLQEARGALAVGQAEGLFLTRRPRMVPPPPDPVDADLRHLVLTVTDRCNLRCHYCLHGADLDWVRSHGEDSMPVETALAALAWFLDRCATVRAPMISFYGGEALLERELIATVIAAARNHPRGRDAVFAIDTNGVLLDAAAVELVARERIHLQISLDGPPGAHDRHRRTAGDEATWRQVIDGVNQLLERDRTTAQRMSFVVTLAPPVDLAELAEFFAHFPPFVRHRIEDPPRVRVNTANLRGQDWPGAVDGARSLAAQIEAAREQYLLAVETGTREHLSPVIRALFEPALVAFHHRNRAPLGETYTPGGNCRPGRRKLHVTTDGRFQPCERTGLVMDLGNVETGIRPDAVRRIQERFHHAVQDRCGECWALRLCGACFAAQAEHADCEAGEFPVPESVCEAVRDNREQVLRMMARILEMPAGRRAFLDETTVE